MTWGWFLYCVLMVWLLGQCVINYRERQNRRAWQKEHKDYAHCKCGARMSEWFVHDGYMWHPIFTRGCGWISPWVDHEHYRDALAWKPAGSVKP